MLDNSTVTYALFDPKMLRLYHRWADTASGTKCKQIRGTNRIVGTASLARLDRGYAACTCMEG